MAQNGGRADGKKKGPQEADNLENKINLGSLFSTIKGKAK